MGDNQSLLASLQGLPCSGSFDDRISAWEKRLADLDATLCGLQTVQRRWIYLEPIFARGTINTEALRFNRVDTDFRNLMAEISADNRIVYLIKRHRGNELVSILANMQVFSQCFVCLDHFP